MTICTHVTNNFTHDCLLLLFAAKKRLKESARDGDNRLSKKARKLAESSLGPKNSILRHMQAAGPGAGHRAPSSKKESSKFPFSFVLRNSDLIQIC